MQQISNLPVFTGTIPNKATQNDTDFANNIFGFLNYSGNIFVADFNSTIGEFNTLSAEIELVASSASTNAGEAKTARDEAVGALATLTAGAIDNTNKGNNKAYSNLKVDELIANIEDTLASSKASAATTTIGAVGSGETLHITGTTTITSFGISQTGVTRNVIFDGSLTLTNNATSLILPTNANITTAAGDTAEFICENGASGYWRCLSYSRLNGGLITPLTISGVSFNGTSNIEIEERLGTEKSSAATTTIGTAGLGDYFHITGTTTITSFGTATSAGIRRTLIFDGVLTLTHHATNLICPGAANIVTVAGTVIEVIAETTTTWRVVSITHPSTSFTDMGSIKDKAPLSSPDFTNNPTAPTQTPGDNSTKLATTAYVDRKMVLGTAVDTTSGTAFDFTNIPSWVKRITVICKGVSLSGASDLLIKLGTSSGITSTGYISTSGAFTGAGQAILQNTTGLVVFLGGSTRILSGLVTLIKLTNNTWVSCHSGKFDTLNVLTGGGDVSLSNTLTSIRITTVNGTDAFDAGKINIMYEG